MQLGPYRRLGRIIAKIAELIRVGVQIEQLRAKFLVQDIFPTLGADHERARVPRLDTQIGAGGAPGIIALADHIITPVNRFSMQQRQQRAAFHAVRLNSAAGGLDKGRQQIDRLDEAVIVGAPGRIGRGARVDNDHRQADRGFVELILLPQPMIPQIIPVIRGEDDHRVVQLAALAKEGDQASNMVVDLLDQPHIGGNDRLTRLGAIEHFAIAMAHEGGVYRMRVGPLGIGADHRDDIIGAVH